MGKLIQLFASSLSRVAVVLLVLHFIPEVLLNFARLFHFAEKPTSVWLFRFGNIVFIVARFLSVIFAVLTFWFGLEPFASHVLRYKQETRQFDYKIYFLH